jgi:hypothetical protein
MLRQKCALVCEESGNFAVIACIACESNELLFCDDHDEGGIYG